MPAARSIHQRREIVERRQQGESFASIARTLPVGYSTARHIYQRFMATGSLTPAYDKCSHCQVRHDPLLYAQAIALKQAHPGWGAGLIRVELADGCVEADLPSVRTLQRWFRRAGVQPARRDRVATPAVERGKAPHEVWAVDAREAMQLADGSYGSWLTITDEGSGAILSAILFPHWQMDHHRPPSGESGASAGAGVLGATRKDQDG